MERIDNRNHNQLRDITIEPNVNIHAEGSVLISFGNTKVICNASIENNVPRWMKNSDEGWVTGEYGMLPRSTNERMSREAARGKQSGRTQEIQRLIGRSLRQAVDLKYLKGKTINVDCDVIQADGGTRCASISGGWVALKLAVKKLLKEGIVTTDPLISPIAAISCGIYAGQPILDLDYSEDSEAGVDGNFIMMGSGNMIETQISAEGSTYSRSQLDELMDLAIKGIKDLIVAQEKATE